MYDAELSGQCMTNVNYTFVFAGNIKGLLALGCNQHYVQRPDGKERTVLLFNPNPLFPAVC